MSASEPAGHIPVLLDRVLALLAPALLDRESTLIDATLGLGGHAEALLAAHPQLTLIGIDRDPEALRRTGSRLAPFGTRVHLVHAVYDELPSVLAEFGLSQVDGVLFDLGVSSMQLDLAERGFSYSRDAPLDMRMDQSAGRTAADIVNTYSVRELARVIAEFGEERFALRIAQAIQRAREQAPLNSTARAGRARPERDPGGHPAHWRAPGQAHVPGVAHRGQRRTRRTCRCGAHGARGVASRRAHRRAVVPLARGPAGQAAVRRPRHRSHAGRLAGAAARTPPAAATAHAWRRSAECGRGRGEPAIGFGPAARRRADPGRVMTATITKPQSRAARPAGARPARLGPGPAGPRRAPFVLLVLGLIGAGLCALLAINTGAAADEVRQRELTTTNADTQDQAQQLQVEIAAKQAPAALASAARALGMVPNPNPAFLVVGADGKVSVLGSPAKVVGPTPKPTPTPTPSSTPSATPSATATAGASVTPTAPSPATPTPTTVSIPGAR